MPPPKRVFPPGLFLLALGGCASAGRVATQSVQAAPAVASGAVAAAMGPITYEVQPEFRRGELTALRVNMTFNGDPDGETVLVQPFDLGASEEEAAKTVSDLEIHNAQAQRIAPRRVRLTHTPSQPLRISYRLQQRIPGVPRDKHAFALIVQPGYFLGLGRSLFAWPDERVEEEAFVKFSGFPAAWRIASTLQHQTDKPRTVIDIHQGLTMAGPATMQQWRELRGASIRVVADERFQPDLSQFSDLTPAIPTTRTGDATLSKNEDATEVQLSPAQVHNHFNQERHLIDRQTYKLRGSAALAEWQTVMA